MGAQAKDMHADCRHIDTLDGQAGHVSGRATGQDEAVTGEGDARLASSKSGVQNERGGEMSTVGRGKSGIDRHAIGLCEGEIAKAECAGLDTRREGDFRGEMDEMRERRRVPRVQVLIEMQADFGAFTRRVKRCPLEGKRRYGRGGRAAAGGKKKGREGSDT
ncbi:hypothetical protein AA0498_1142 [Acidomonas methanolica]|nr:hypothetical protein AA0498_1142 [Acidomonas methanolica]